ncbi:hypothetical protein BGZ97_006059 [Linnemannia gamsii]|uniref:Uncharacterized protein n=1 Tax=Linnemannia gamsii TaxID=64522 RepID=A0A9P6RLP1_9FUNG|nr:hypothetical protein BGZ97_006059 [Linnemannia gamsii]
MGSHLISCFGSIHANIKRTINKGQTDTDTITIQETFLGTGQQMNMLSQTLYEILALDIDRVFGSPYGVEASSTTMPESLSSGQLSTSTLTTATLPSPSSSLQTGPLDTLQAQFGQDTGTPSTPLLPRSTPILNGTLGCASQSESSKTMKATP